MKFTVLLAFILLLTGCVAHRSFSDASKWIPADFNIQKDFLLVQTFPVSRKTNEKMTAWLAQNYPGHYEIVDKSTIYGKSVKYTDTRKYRFAFVWGSITETIKGSNPNPNGFGNLHYYDYNGNFYDRSVGKEYPTTRKYNNYGGKAYIPFFNSIIKHFR